MIPNKLNSMTKIDHKEYMLQVGKIVVLLTGIM